MFEIIKENLDIITRGVIRTVIIRFLIFSGLFLVVSFISIFIGSSLGGMDKTIKCEDRTQSGVVISGECNNQILKNKNLFDIEDSPWSVFVSFVSNNWNNIIFIVFALIVVYQLIIPPKGYEEFLDRIYHYFLDIIAKDENLRDLVFINKNITKGNGFIRFSIKGIPQNIHFELYVMDFKNELLKDSKTHSGKAFKKVGEILKLGTKGEYLQLQLHFEDMSQNALEKIKGLEDKYLSKYNIVPHRWDLLKLRAHLSVDTVNVGYVLESKITRKDILGNSEHEEFYRNGFTRESIYEIFKNEILENASKEKFLASYVNFGELSRNDIKIMAENYLQSISYYLKNDEFLEDLRKLT